MTEPTTMMVPEGSEPQRGIIPNRPPRLATTMLKTQVDPRLDGIDADHDKAKHAINAANADPGTYVFEETGEVYSDAEAKRQFDHDINVVTSDRAAGKTHHGRAAVWLVLFGIISPFLEALGTLVMLQAWFNVDIIRPWTNWFAWTATVVIVIVVSVTQKLTAEAAGKAHNAGRQEDHEKHDEMADAHFRTRNWMLVSAGVIALFVSASLAVRGLQSLGAPLWWQAALIVLASVITGVGTAALAYCAKAFDGSVYSRRADALGAQGEGAAQEQDVHIETATKALTDAANEDESLITAVLPAIVEDVRQSVNGDPDETMASLQPVAERVRRLEAQRIRRQALEADLKQVTRLAFARAG